MLSVLKSVFSDFTAFFSFNSKRGRVRLAVVAVAAVILLIFIASANDSTSKSITASVPTVELLAVGEYNHSSDLTLLGEVRSASEVLLQAQTSGQITSVPVSLGQVVKVGDIIARLDGADEYAALLQAEGAYEAALAAAATSEVSVEGAVKNLNLTHSTARTSLENNISTIQNIFYNDLDEIFADPHKTYRSSGFLSGEDAALLRTLNFTYDRLSEMVPTLVVPNEDSALTANGIGDVFATIDDLQLVVSTLRTLIASDDFDKTQDSTAAQYLTTLSSTASTLNSLETSVSTTLRNIESAKETLEKAQFGGTGTAISAASAQVKQALGALKAAEANYNKTILRSPIAGTVASLPIQVGNYLSQNAEAATITNENASEIIVYVNENDREGLEVGQTVTFENGGAGSVLSISPSLSASTGKIEVRITSSDSGLLSGDTVRVNIEKETTANTNVISVPLNAVKFNGGETVIFTVSPENTLEAKRVTLGRPHGSDIVVESGLTSDITIIADARGRTAGEVVNIK